MCILIWTWLSKGHAKSNSKAFLRLWVQLLWDVCPTKTNSPIFLPFLKYFTSLCLSLFLALPSLMMLLIPGTLGSARGWLEILLGS